MAPQPNTGFYFTDPDVDNGLTFVPQKLHKIKSFKFHLHHTLSYCDVGLSFAQQTWNQLVGAELLELVNSFCNCDLLFMVR